MSVGPDLADVGDELGALLEREGCDCDCDHSYTEHLPECEQCLGCRVEAAARADKAKLVGLGTVEWRVVNERNDGERRLTPWDAESEEHAKKIAKEITWDNWTAVIETRRVSDWSPSPAAPQEPAPRHNVIGRATPAPMPAGCAGCGDPACQNLNCPPPVCYCGSPLAEHTPSTGHRFVEQGGEGQGRELAGKHRCDTCEEPITCEQSNEYDDCPHCVMLNEEQQMEDREMGDS